MKDQIILAGKASGVAVLLALASCTSSQTPQTQDTQVTTQQQQAVETNPLLQEWTGPYGGVPASTK
ncbi:hypothetical protein [Pontibacter sp. BAB1700]|uniref:hypothetical protein n=1 Tax=Pontibacter sp. BAB1700 TaxID=1144253 RepID=UPI001ED97CAC|nr:hypothetical protein [Pontibacter sp. BAB1700]